MTQVETQKQMCEILMPSRGFDAVMKTSCHIMDPKRDGGGIRSAHTPHQTTTACFIVPKQQRTPSPRPRSAVASSTVHHLSGQVHINQKPTCLSVDAENDISPVRGVEFSPNISLQNSGKPVLGCPVHPRAEQKAFASVISLNSGRAELESS